MVAPGRGPRIGPSPEPQVGRSRTASADSAHAETAAGLRAAAVSSDPSRYGVVMAISCAGDSSPRGTLTVSTPSENDALMSSVAICSGRRMLRSKRP